MSWSTCMTCGQTVRDFDEQPHGQPTKLPRHGTPECMAPKGEYPWNDGEHAWDDYRFEYVPLDRVTIPLKEVR